jgi:hypothetical protein
MSYLYSESEVDKFLYCMDSLAAGSTLNEKIVLPVKLDCYSYSNGPYPVYFEHNEMDQLVSKLTNSLYDAYKYYTEEPVIPIYPSPEGLYRYSYTAISCGSFHEYVTELDKSYPEYKLGVTFPCFYSDEFHITVSAANIRYRLQGIDDGSGFIVLPPDAVSALYQLEDVINQDPWVSDDTSKSIFKEYRPKLDKCLPGDYEYAIHMIMNSPIVYARW